MARSIFVGKKGELVKQIKLIWPVIKWEFIQNTEPVN